MNRRISRKLLLATAAVSIAGLALAGCTSGAGTSGDGGETKGSVVFIPGTTGVAFYEAMRIAAEEKAEELGLDFSYQGAADWTPSLQTPVVDGVCTNKPDVLIVTPTDGKALASALQRCIDAGVQIITVDTVPDPSTPVVTQITADNLQGGALAAEFVAGQIGGAGKVVVIGGQATASTNIERVQGFEDYMSENYPDIEQVQTQWTESQDPTKAQSIMSDLLVANPDITGAFCVIEKVAEGCGAAIEQSGKDVTLVAYDASQTMVDLMKSQTVDALVAQPNVQQMLQAMEDAAKVIAGDTSGIQPELKLENRLIPADEVDDPESQKYFYILN